MKLQEAKEKIAEKEGFNNWEEFSEFTNYANDYEIAFNEAAELYAEQKAKEESILFANFIGNRPLPEYSESTNQWRWWNNETREYNYATTEQLYEQFKNSTL